jgi:hypothetical protein
MKRRSYFFDDEQITGLKKLKDKSPKGTTIADLVRRAVDMLLKASKRTRRR